MNYCQLPLPTPKRRSAEWTTKSFPIDSIPDENCEKRFVGIFNGLSVEIINHEDIKHLYSNGCFGESTKTKTCPESLMEFPRVKNMTQALYRQKLAWYVKYRAMEEDELDIASKFECVDEDYDGDGVRDVGDISNIGNIEIDDPSTDDQPRESAENTADNTEPMKVVKEPRKNDHLTMIDPFPIEEALALTPEEAFFLHFALRCLKVFNFEKTHEFTTDELLDKFCVSNPKFIERYIAYHYYRSRNWIVKSGLKFGGDFVLYYKGPMFYHSSYAVIVSDSDDQLNQLDMQSNYRVADSTSKQIILATVTRPDNLDYSNARECLNRINEFKITEIIPKRFLITQLHSMQPKS